MDAFGDPTLRDPVSPFVELLWERGGRFEKETMQGLGQPFLDLSGLPPIEREQQTIAAMERGEPLIYQGRIRHDDLLGQPDLLRREGTGYVPGDIKSGAGEEGAEEDNHKPKAHYAVQLGLYIDILERLELSAGRRGFVWDIHSEEVLYDFDVPRSPRAKQTLWQLYEQALASCRRILQGQEQTLPALAAPCKLCYWKTACKAAVRAADDLSLIPELGRKKRDAMHKSVPTVADLARIDPEGFIKGTRTPFKGVGAASLRKFRERAQLLKANGKPYLTQPVSLPPSQQEIHFDLEADPFRDHVYLHGFLIRDQGEMGSKFVPIVAEQPTAEAERQAFAAAIDLLRAWPKALVFVYSAYERTTYRKLQERYPDVLSREEVDELFSSRTIDLYRVVKSSTEWPTNDYSIKTLAQYLGFRWRDENPSGAASIEWYERFVETEDRTWLQRIVDYNEDDCRAMVVLLDSIRAMQYPKALRRAPPNRQ
jgi:uncharacterized protein